MAGLQWLCGMLNTKAETSGYYPNLHVGMADELTDEDQFLGKSVKSLITELDVKIEELQRMEAVKDLEIAEKEISKEV